MKLTGLLTVGLVLTMSGGAQAPAHQKTAPARFFSDDSFWNQPLPANPEIDPRSSYWIGLMKTDQQRNVGVNATRFTIPVYEVNASTPLKTVLPRSTFYRHAKDFPEKAPIPDGAIPDAQSDHHLALIDRAAHTAWDMWEAENRNGQWYSNTGIKYDLNGPGVFSTAELGVKNGESVHQHGPGRAPGVPIIAGLAMYDEVESGHIRHKIAAATRFVAYQEFVFPAAWTDGTCDGGIPEGSVLQLDPKLDLLQFDLTPEERTLARAMQEYGMVLVDYAGANVVYAEGLYGQKNKNWDGKIREWTGGIVGIPMENYRVLAVNNSVHQGDKHYQEKIPACKPSLTP
jgi:hypothetical protein